MELRKLRHVCALAHAGNYGRAAQQLHITQSALSRSVQALERELQVRIFDRGREGVQLTAAGRIFVERAQAILLATRGLQHDLALAEKGEYGEVAIGLGPVPASIVLPELLTEVARESRRLQLRVELNNAAALLQAVLEERIEFAVCTVTHLSVTSDLVLAPLANLPVSLFVRAGHPLAGGAAGALEVFRFPLMSGCMPRETLDAMLRSAGFDAADGRPPLIGCDDLSALRAAVLASDAVLITARATVGREIETGALVDLCRIPFPAGIAATLQVVRLARRGLSPAGEHLLGKVRSLCAGPATQPASGRAFTRTRG